MYGIKIIFNKISLCWENKLIYPKYPWIEAHEAQYFRKEPDLVLKSVHEKILKHERKKRIIQTMKMKKLLRVLK